MKKYLILLLFLIVVPVHAGWYYGEADSCPSGTYVFSANGEESDSSYACFDNGASTADASNEDAGVIDAAGAINGNYGFVLDADGEDVTWSHSNANLIDAGTIEANITTPSSFTGQFNVIAETFYNALSSDNHIVLYLDAGTLRGKYRGNGTSQYSSGTALSVNTTYTVCYTWRNSGTERHCERMDSGKDSGCTGDGSWNCQNETLTSLAGTPDRMAVGEAVHISSGTFDLVVDDVKIREGYEE